MAIDLSEEHRLIRLALPFTSVYFGGNLQERSESDREYADKHLATDYVMRTHEGVLIQVGHRWLGVGTGTYRRSGSEVAWPITVRERTGRNGGPSEWPKWQAGSVHFAHYDYMRAGQLVGRLILDVTKAMEFWQQLPNDAQATKLAEVRKISTDDGRHWLLFAPEDWPPGVVAFHDCQERGVLIDLRNGVDTIWRNQVYTMSRDQDFFASRNPWQKQFLRTMYRWPGEPRLRQRREIADMVHWYTRIEGRRPRWKFCPFIPCAEDEQYTVWCHQQAGTLSGVHG